MLILFYMQDEVLDDRSEFLKLFIDPSFYDAPGADQVALSWVLTGVVIAVCCAALMAIGKWTIKERAHLGKKHWTLLKVVGWLLLGWIPILFSLGIIYYFSISYIMVLAIGGYFKGVIFTALTYGLIMLIVDFVVPRFRSDYGL